MSSLTFTYDQIIEAARQTIRDERARDMARKLAAIKADDLRRANPGPTALQIHDLEVGDLVATTFDTDGQGNVLEGARWGASRVVVQIAYRGVSAKGKDYVGVDTEFGPTSTLGFSIGEGEQRYRITKAV